MSDVAFVARRRLSNDRPDEPPVDRARDGRREVAALRVTGDARIQDIIDQIPTAPLRDAEIAAFATAQTLERQLAALERKLGELRANDTVAYLHVEVPAPLRACAAVGEVSIPIAKAVDTVAQAVPLVGELIAAEEALTGRELLGLGEKTSARDRLFTAATALAPVAGQLLLDAAAGARAVLRIAEMTRRSTSEIVACLRDARRAQMEGRAAFEARPRLTRDPHMPAGSGATDKFGNVTISTRGTAKDRALAFRHESVHSMLSPKTLNALQSIRADVGMTAYARSSLCRYLEEAMAETYAQVRVNGPTAKAVFDGVRFPVHNGYVTLRAVIGEGAIASVAYGGVLYGVYAAVDARAPTARGEAP